ncbi:MAG: type I-E CRISPR-associated protein Cse1/CasA [Myxococcota bacterium]
MGAINAAATSLVEVRRRAPGKLVTESSEPLHFNAWTSPWLPLRQGDGSTRWASPVEVLSGAQDGIDLDYPRDDFRVYARLLLSALIQAVLPAKDSSELERHLEVPLTRAEVEARIRPVLAEFDLFGATPFLQVLRPANPPEKGAAAFVFVAEDLFRAPTPVEAISLPIALLSIFIEQTYAGGAGRGYGAGPAGQPGAFTLLDLGSVRRSAWANSLHRAFASEIYVPDGDRPWSNQKRPAAPRSSIGLVSGLFFQPRAIWLEPAGVGTCSFSGVTGPLVRRSPILPKSELAKKQPGAEDLWRHPCAPLALNTQGIGAIRLCADRPIWTELAQLLRPVSQATSKGKKIHPAEGPALVLQQWRALRRRDGSAKLIILDFERDKANVRARFFESTLANEQLLGNDEAIEKLRAVTEDAIDVLRSLTKALARARGERKTEGTSLADARAAFWCQIELPFFEWLGVLTQSQGRNGSPPTHADDAERALRTTMRSTALRIFDAHAALAEFDSRKQRAVAIARRLLIGVLRGAAPEARRSMHDEARL